MLAAMKIIRPIDGVNLMNGCFASVAKMSPEKKYDWLERLRTAKAQELPAYIKQMSIQAYLKTRPICRDTHANPTL